MPVRALVPAGALFGFTSNNLRVTLARLLSRGLVDRDERGVYRLAVAARAVQSQVASWTDLHERMVPWNGSWVGVHTGGLPRGARSAQRRRQRALDFLGMRALAPHLWVRPDNLTGGVPDVRRRLQALGLAADAPVFALAVLDDAAETRARALWDTATLRAGYYEMVATLEASAARLSTLPLVDALVEAFLLGRDAIRLLVFDPLLPEPLVPPDERDALVQCMRRYDRQGHDLWSVFRHQRGGPPIESLLHAGLLETAGGEMVPAGGML